LPGGLTRDMAESSASTATPCGTCSTRRPCPSSTRRDAPVQASLGQATTEAHHRDPDTLLTVTAPATPGGPMGGRAGCPEGNLSMCARWISCLEAA
jgi:hypothetical protein